MSREQMLTNRDVRPIAFVHIVLRARRFVEMVAFYKLFLNAWEVMGSTQFSFQTYDQEHHRIAIINIGDAPALDPRAAGVDHFAYAYASLGELLGNYVRLKDLRILPFLCINHGATTSLYYRDSDGNQIETQTDNFDTREELTSFFNSDVFRDNPLGVQFDPDRLVELYRQGRTEAELKRQGSAPRLPESDYLFNFNEENPR